VRQCTPQQQLLELLTKIVELPISRSIKNFFQNVPVPESWSRSPLKSSHSCRKSSEFFDNFFSYPSERQTRVGKIQCLGRGQNYSAPLLLSHYRV